MSEEKFVNVDEIPWMSSGEDATGNKVQKGNPDFPSGSLNRPILHVFNNTVFLNKEIERLKNNPTLRWSSKAIQVLSNPESIVVIGSENSRCEKPLSTILASASVEMNSIGSVTFGCDNVAIFSKKGWNSAFTSSNSRIDESHYSTILNSANSFLRRSTRSSIENSFDTYVEDSVNSTVKDSLSVSLRNCERVVVLGSRNLEVEGKKDLICAGASDVTTSEVAWSLDNVTGRLTSKSGVSLANKNFGYYLHYSFDEPQLFSAVALDYGSVKVAFSEDHTIFGIIGDPNTTNMLGDNSEGVLVVVKGFVLAKVVKDVPVNSFLTASSIRGCLKSSDIRTNIVSYREVEPYSRKKGYALHEVILL